MLGWRSARETWYAALLCMCICFAIVFICCLVGSFTLPLKFKVPMSSMTEVKCGLSPPAILKEIPCSNLIFGGIYGVYNHATTSFNKLTKNRSKAVDLSSTAVTASVCYCWKNINCYCIIVLLTSLSKKMCAILSHFLVLASEIRGCIFRANCTHFVWCVQGMLVLP